MNPFKHFLETVAIAAAILLPVSCEKDNNPTPEKRSEMRSTIDFSWNGTRYTQSAQQTTPLTWNVVNINGQSRIVAQVTMSPGGNRAPEVDIYPTFYLCLPFEDVQIGMRYTEKEQLSLVTFQSDNKFIAHNAIVSRVCFPLSVTVKYSRTDKGLIQGEFSAEGGKLELFDGETLDVNLEKGTFRLYEQMGLTEDLSHDKWQENVNSAYEYADSFNASHPRVPKDILDFTTWTCRMNGYIFGRSLEYIATLRFASPNFYYTEYTLWDGAIEPDEVIEEEGTYTVNGNIVTFIFTPPDASGKPIRTTEGILDGDTLTSADGAETYIKD